MKSRATQDFWRLFDQLNAGTQDHARRAYRQFAIDPSHPGLHFKRVGRKRPIYSVRIGIQYRAVGLLEGDTITWFWIGAHDGYERLLGG